MFVHEIVQRCSWPPESMWHTPPVSQYEKQEYGQKCMCFYIVSAQVNKIFKTILKL